MRKIAAGWPANKVAHKSYGWRTSISRKQAKVRKYAFLSNLMCLKTRKHGKHQCIERYFCVYLRSKALF